MEVRVLGPVEAIGEHGPLPLGGMRPRAIVAALALQPGQVMSTGRLVEEVWPGQPPRSAVDTLQSYMSRLRRAFGGGSVLVGRSGGYVLAVPVDAVDASAFVADVERARAAVEQHDLRAASVAYQRALGRWRGEVADGLELGTLTRAAIARLSELRLVATEERGDVELSLGRHDDLAGELEAMVAGQPLRERLHAQRMLALYRSGRQADALAAYRQARDALVDGLGIEPGPWLRELHQRILAQDRDLDAPAEPAGARVEPLEGRAEVPAVVTGEPAPPAGNLPAPLDTFVGRGAERRSVAALLGDVRLLTLTGAGGCGKTQLALQVAADVAESFAGQVWYVELGAHAEPGLVDRAIAEALGVAEAPSGALREVVGRRMGSAPVLLVLDNCEHLIDACADTVTELLGSCGGLVVLTTSREPLDVPGEHAWRVPSLTVPSPDADVEAFTASEAGQLLVMRAQAARPGFELTAGNVAALTRICRELDGIPLALELAAARLRAFDAADVAERLGDRFRLLSQGRRTAPARHRTLQAAIDWSYDLLDPAERTLLDRLSVFSAGFTLDAVEGVCSGSPVAPSEVVPRVAGLIDKSLVQRVRTTAGPARHDLLATVRTYAGQRLAPAEAERLADRHSQYFAGLADRAAPALTTSDQVDWLNRLHVEHDNLRAVLARGGSAPARVAAGVWWFWLGFGHVLEGDDHLSRLLADGGPADPELRRRLHLGAGRLARARYEHPRAERHLNESLSLAADLRDADGRARALAELALCAAAVADGVLAVQRLERGRASARQADDPWTLAALEEAAGHVGWRAGRLNDAARAFAAAERSYRTVGDQWSACLARLGAARVARQEGDVALAARLHRDNLVASLDLTVSSFDFIGLPQDLLRLASVAAQAGQADLAATLIGAGATLRTTAELPLTPPERVEHARTLRLARQALGGSAADAAYGRGRSLSAELAVREALDRSGGLAEPAVVGVDPARNGQELHGTAPPDRGAIDVAIPATGQDGLQGLGGRVRRVGYRW